MPALGKPQLERFAQLLAKGGFMTDALIEARGGNTISLRTGKEITRKNLSVMACEMARRPEIKARVAELRGEITAHLAIDASKIQERVAREIELTNKKLIDEADKIQKAAMSAKQYGNATQALIAKAKLAGLWIERSEATNANYAISDKPLTIEEFDAKYLTKH